MPTNRFERMPEGEGASDGSRFSARSRDTGERVSKDARKILEFGVPGPGEADSGPIWDGELLRTDPETGRASPVPELGKMADRTFLSISSREFLSILNSPLPDGLTARVAFFRADCGTCSSLLLKGVSGSVCAACSYESEWEIGEGRTGIFPARAAFFLPPSGLSETDVPQFENSSAWAVYNLEFQGFRGEAAPSLAKQLAAFGAVLDGQGVPREEYDAFFRWYRSGFSKGVKRREDWIRALKAFTDAVFPDTFGGSASAEAFGKFAPAPWPAATKQGLALMYGHEVRLSPESALGLNAALLAFCGRVGED